MVGAEIDAWPVPDEHRIREASFRTMAAILKRSSFGAGGPAPASVAVGSSGQRKAGDGAASRTLAAPIWGKIGSPVKRYVESGLASTHGRRGGPIAQVIGFAECGFSRLSHLRYGPSGCALRLHLITMSPRVSHASALASSSLAKVRNLPHVANSFWRH